MNQTRASISFNNRVDSAQKSDPSGRLDPDCGLCSDSDEKSIVYRNEILRVIWVDDVRFPGFCRVISQIHVAEMLDLSEHQQNQIWQAVLCVAHWQRTLLNPDKINLASLGNQVPHLHWHIIPRWQHDSHFPDSIWAQPVRVSAVEVAPEQLKLFRETLAQDLGQALKKSAFSTLIDGVDDQNL